MQLLLLSRILAIIITLMLLVSATTSTLYHPRRKRPFYFLVDYEVEAFEISDTGELNYTYPKHHSGGIFV